ncbi:MAG: hypothetical protein OXG24_00375 [Gammaproteobacteria bacterium]|nr:hypothetical protein [Gammaproteobacteria bacterium]
MDSLRWMVIRFTDWRLVWCQRKVRKGSCIRSVEQQPVRVSSTGIVGVERATVFGFALELTCWHITGLVRVSGV